MKHRQVSLPFRREADGSVSHWPIGTDTRSVLPCRKWPVRVVSPGPGRSCLSTLYEIPPLYRRDRDRSRRRGRNGRRSDRGTLSGSAICIERGTEGDKGEDSPRAGRRAPLELLEMFQLVDTTTRERVIAATFPGTSSDAACSHAREHRGSPDLHNTQREIELAARVNVSSPTSFRFGILPRLSSTGLSGYLSTSELFLVAVLESALKLYGRWDAQYLEIFYFWKALGWLTFRKYSPFESRLVSSHHWSEVINSTS